MSGFASDWLALREPADRRARSPAIVAAVASHLDALGASRDEPRPPVRVTDLGCGTGSTLRALCAQLPARQHWLLVDNDAALLAQAVRRAGEMPPSVTVAPLQADLQADLEAVVARDADLLAASAFLDLVSRPWLERLVAAAAAHRRAVYVALSYDGRVACDPVDPFDASVLSAFDAHQRGDKGLGGALGPMAAATAVACFEAAGFEVVTAPADWRLGHDEGALQAQLLQGWHQAAAETGTLPAPDLDAWLARRLAAIAAGRSRLRVGHLDLWARPREP